MVHYHIVTRSQRSETTTGACYVLQPGPRFDFPVPVLPSQPNHFTLFPSEFQSGFWCEAGSLSIATVTASSCFRWTNGASQSVDTLHPSLVHSSPARVTGFGARWSRVGGQVPVDTSPLHLFIRLSSLWESLLTSCVWECTLDISSLHMILSAPALGSAFPLPQPAVAAAAATAAAAASARGSFR